MRIEQNNKKILNLIRCCVFFGRHGEEYCDSVSCDNCTLGLNNDCNTIGECISRNVIHNSLKNDINKIPHIMQLLDCMWCLDIDNKGYFIKDADLIEEYLFLEKRITGVEGTS